MTAAIAVLKAKRPLMSAVTLSIAQCVLRSSSRSSPAAPFAPLRVIIPWVNSRLNGSCTSSRPMSLSALTKKRAYMRCSTACSTPPMYWSTGAQRARISGSHGAAVHDRDRATPVALAREQPVAEPVVDRAVPAAVRVEPRDDRLERLAVVHAVEARIRVD